jgi:hypothetical protein
MADTTRAGRGPAVEPPTHEESADSRPETELQRWDRNFTELLQELRVAQTGVQILFGFLLTVPFSNRFGQATTLQTVVYSITLLGCAITTALLIAPVSQHRRVFRQGLKAELVEHADRLAQAGLFSLMLTLSGAVFLVLDVVAGLAAAAPLAAGVATVYYLLWYRPALFAGRHSDDFPEAVSAGDKGRAADDYSRHPNQAQQPQAAHPKAAHPKERNRP